MAMYCVVVKARTRRNEELNKMTEKNAPIWKRYWKYLPGERVCLE